MPERAGYEQVFSPEKEASGQKVEIGHVEDIVDLIEGDLASVGDQAGELSYSEFATLMKGHREEDLALLDNPGPQTLERKMVDTFWGVHKVIENQVRSSNLQGEYEKGAQLSREREIKRQRNEINTQQANWQIEMIRLTLALGQEETGKKYLGLVWQSLEGVGKGRERDVEALKTGIKGAVTAVKILEKSGLEVALPSAEQDAIDKIDLFARTPDGAVTLLIQIKSHDRPEVSVRVFALDEISVSSDEKMVQNAAILIEKAGEYGESWRRRVRPLLVDLDCAGGTRLTREELTGIPNLEDFGNTALYREIDQIVHGEKSRA